MNGNSSLVCLKMAKPFVDRREIREDDPMRQRRLQLMPMETAVVAVQRALIRVAPYVVHLKRKDGIEIVSCDLYIGSSHKMGGWNLERSKWANPFSLKKCDYNIKKMLDTYEAYIRETPRLINSITELEGKGLGCWCHPEPCHGDVLVKLFLESK